MKTIFSLILLAGLFACGASKIKGDGSGQTIETKKMQKGEPAILGYSKIEADSLLPLTIDSAYISGNNLMVTVKYGGGCEKHDFRLEGQTAISKSLPPIRSIRVVHTGKKDMCKALIIKNLQFDLTELAYTKEEGSQIKLSLEGYKEQLMYTYSSK